MHQRLVVAVFVAAAELQVAVQEQAQVAARRGEHDALVGRGLRVDHRVGVDRGFRRLGDPVGIDEPGHQRGERQQPGDPMRRAPSARRRRARRAARAPRRC